MQTRAIYSIYPGVLGIALLCGCATAPKPVPPLDTNYEVRVEQMFEDVPNGTYINFQLGQRVIPGDLDRWSTYCQLYVASREHGADYTTSVVPGTFAISEVKIGYESSAYPGKPRFHWLSWGVRDAPAFYVYEVGMRLHSPDQPDVLSLICYKKWNVPRADQYPTLAQIRRALGHQIRIIPPPSAATRQQSG